MNLIEPRSMNGAIINHRVLRFLFLLSSLLLLLSCGGGGDKDSAAVAGTGTEGGALKGRIRVKS